MIRKPFLYRGLFISPSGISELDCATTKTDTAERSISIGRESLQVIFVLLTCSFLPCLSWLLRSRVWKSRRVIYKSLRDFRTQLRHFSSRLPLSGGTCKYAKAPSTKKSWRDSLPIDMLLSAASVLVVAQSSPEIPEELANNPV